MVASLFFGHFVLKFWTFRFGDYIHNDYSREINKKITEIITSKRNLNKPKKAFEEVQELIKKSKNRLEKEVLLGNKDVNDIVNF